MVDTVYHYAGKKEAALHHCGVERLLFVSVLKFFSPVGAPASPGVEFLHFFGFPPAGSLLSPAVKESPQTNINRAANTNVSLIILKLVRLSLL